jgi:hypothetical protein
LATYTLHVPQGSYPGEVHALDDARVVRDGFQWGAFVFSFLWFFWNRLWLAGFAVLAVAILLQVGVSFLPVGPLASFWTQVFLSLLIGLEASSLQRWTHERRGRPAVALVSARDESEAEEKCFEQWLSRRGEPGSRLSPASTTHTGDVTREPALGLFPQMERRR